MALREGSPALAVGGALAQAEALRVPGGSVGEGVSVALAQGEAEALALALSLALAQ